MLKKNIGIQKLQYTNILETIENCDLIFFFIDIFNYNLKTNLYYLKLLKKNNKPIIVIFNKIDLIQKELILSYIDQLNSSKLVDDFFNISAKYDKNFNFIFKYLIKRSNVGLWENNNDEITNKSDEFISAECTRNAILKYLHKEIPYNISVKNKQFKFLKNKNIKIKQFIEIETLR